MSLNPKRWGGPVTDHPFNVKDQSLRKDNKETEPSIPSNKAMQKCYSCKEFIPVCKHAFYVNNEDCNFYKEA